MKESLWDVGEVVKEQEEKELFFYTCPFRCGKNTSDRCQRAACALWFPEEVTKTVGDGLCAFAFMALGINRDFLVGDK